MTSEEIQARKVALKSTIDSHKRQIEPLEKELKELRKLESELKNPKNEKEGA